ncbi:MAG TPA: Qat anti-phage system QueC-like protein QatC [Phycisphaerae bacterium]|nr:Qat anti-phage system QueC-like protein QatC [Phycisphaerae bacterium]
MTWHVIVRIGTGDAFFPTMGQHDPRLVVVFEDATNRRYVNNNVLDRIRQELGQEPSPVVTDLLHVAMAIYSADLRVNRKHGTDRWSRDFMLHLPVSDVAMWTPVTTILSRMLHFLTGDDWKVSFRQRILHLTPEVQAVQPRNIDVVSLFSGGLDSLVGAIDLLASRQRVALVGHHGAGMANAVQTAVFDVLQRRFTTNAMPFMFYVQPPRSDADDGEPTMRSRSILFLSLGVAIAKTVGNGVPLVVSENGLISLNVPLTRSRTGSSSTRTTHPHFLALFRQLATTLDLAVPIRTPYRFQTKGEMLRNCTSQDALRDAAIHSMSCSHPEAGRYRGHSPGQHCGYCVPCIIRRASLHAAQLPQSAYVIDVTQNPPDPKTKTGSDFRAFQMALERLRHVRDSRFLFDVLATGPIPPEDASEFAGVYRRGMEEVRALLE